MMWQLKMIVTVVIVPAMTASHDDPCSVTDVCVLSVYVHPLLASCGISGSLVPEPPVTLMSSRLVVPSFVGGGGIEYWQVVATPTSVRSTLANPAVSVTA